MTLVADLGFGFLLGFSLTIPPGPMNALIASISARDYRAGVVTGLGAMSADLVLGGLVYSLDAVVDLAPVVRWVYAVGAVVMALFAARLLRTPRDDRSVDDGAVLTYARAVGLGLSNPFQIAWWITAGLAFAYLGGPVLLIGLFGAIAVWVVTFPFAIHAGARRYPSVQRPIAWASAAILLGFAAYFAILAAVG